MKRNIQLPLYSIVISRFKVDALIAKVARCGGYNFGFEAELKVTTNSLDKDGFVVHNEKLVDALRMHFGYGTTDPEKRGNDKLIWRATCEELTSGIAFVISKMVPAARLTGMEIKVFNHMGFTTLTWQKGDAIPEFPRLATKAEIEETRKHNKAHGSTSSC